MAICNSCGGVFVGEICPFCNLVPLPPERDTLDKFGWDTDPTIKFENEKYIHKTSNCAFTGIFQKDQNGIQDASDIFLHVNAKLDRILNRFDESEQVIITNIFRRLDTGQTVIVQNILDGIETHRISESDLHDKLEAIQQTLVEIKQNNTDKFDPQLMSEIKKLSEIVDDPKLDVIHKLKISIPIIPTILSYENELGLKSGLNLMATWKKLRQWSDE